VTGHRLARLGAADLAAIAATAREILERIATGAAQHGAALPNLVTNLADGADSIVADAALDLNWDLDAVLPFAREDYASDYIAGETREALLRHLSAAHRTFELPGIRNGDSLDALAYERAGRIVIAQSDLLIGVWDREPALGRGGAAQIIAEAVAQAMPVILIDPAGKRSPELLWDGLAEIELGEQTIDTVPSATLDRLDDLIGFLLDRSDEAEDSRLLAAFEADAEPREVSLALAYPLLVRLMTLGKHRFGPAPRASAAHDRPTTLSPDAAATVRQPFIRADKAAKAAARLFRSSYVLNFSLAACAVLLSMLGLALPHGIKPVLVILEVVTILSILLLTRTGIRRNWHRGWLDNRQLAERLRCLELGVQLGDLDLRGDHGHHAGWACWYGRAVARSVGLPDARVDAGYLDKVRAALIELVDEQIAYLGEDARRMRTVEHRLHRLGTFLFAATALVCLALLGFKLAAALIGDHTFEATGAPFTTGATIASAVLPAIGAAIYGIRMQGDFAGTASRDEELCHHLAGLRRVVAESPADFDQLQRRVRRLTDLLTENQANWRQAYHARPLALPG